MQTRISDQPAYLIHRRNWQNSSLILDLMTRDFGRLNILAKGGKNSKTVGLFQPFNRLMVSWTGRHELKTLTSYDGNIIPIDERLYFPLLYVNELIENFLPKFEPYPELFELYGNLLASVDTGNIEILLREFERSAMQVLGYLPDMGVTSEQGDQIETSSSYQFSPSEGLIHCEPEQIGAIDGSTIIAWNNHQYGDKVVGQTAKMIMRSIIDFNLHGKRLKSRDMYLQIKQRA